MLGNQEKKDLVRILESYFSEDAAPAVHVGDMREAKRYEDLSANRSEEHTPRLFKGAGRLQPVLFLLHYPFSAAIYAPVARER